MGCFGGQWCKRVQNGAFVILLRRHDVVDWHQLRNEADYDCFVSKLTTGYLVFKEQGRLPEAKKSCPSTIRASAARSWGEKRVFMGFLRWLGRSNNLCGFFHVIWITEIGWYRAESLRSKRYRRLEPQLLPHVTPWVLAIGIETKATIGIEIEATPAQSRTLLDAVNSRDGVSWFGLG